jgi:hypothetical protein
MRGEYGVHRQRNRDYPFSYDVNSLASRRRIELEIAGDGVRDPRNKAAGRSLIIVERRVGGRFADQNLSNLGLR